MVVGRDAVLIKHEGEQSESQKIKDLERKGKWEKALQRMLDRVNNVGGQNAIESE